MKYIPNDGTVGYKIAKVDKQHHENLVDERLTEMIQDSADKISKLQETISNYEYEVIVMKNDINKYKIEIQNSNAIISNLQSELKQNRIRAYQNEKLLREELTQLKQNYEEVLSRNNFTHKAIQPAQTESSELSLKINDLESQLSEWKQFSYDKEIDLKDYKYLNEKQGKELIELEKKYNELINQQKTQNQPNSISNNSENSQIIHTEMNIPSTPTDSQIITTTTDIIKAPEVQSEIIINDPINIPTNENVDNIIISTTTIIPKEVEKCNENNDERKEVSEEYINEKKELENKINEQALIIEELKKNISKSEENESIIKEYENQIEILQKSIESLSNNLYQY